MEMILLMIKNVQLIVEDDYETLINSDTGEIICEGHKLSAEDVLFGLGYRFEIIEKGE